MVFYSLISTDILDKSDFKKTINQAKKDCLKEALAKLREFDAMNETFF